MLADHVLITLLALYKHSVYCRICKTPLDSSDLEKYYFILENLSFLLLTLITFF